MIEANLGVDAVMNAKGHGTIRSMAVERVHRMPTPYGVRQGDAFADLGVILPGMRAAMGLRSTFQLPPGNLR